MTKWYCFKCKEKMEGAEIDVVFLEVENKAPGLKCPKCGTSYIMEETAVGEMAKGEKMIEQK